MSNSAATTKFQELWATLKVALFLSDEDLVMECPYCGQPAELVTGKQIYPHRSDLHKNNFYRCVPCNAYVGCHKGTTTPLGALANARLRTLRHQCHEVFDLLWKGGFVVRSNAYSWLAKQLDIPKDECHIGMFDESRCKQTLKIMQELRNSIR